MRTVLAFAMLLTMATSTALAGGLFGDVTKAVGRATFDAGRAIEKGAHDTGKAVEKATQDAGNSIEKGVQDTGKTIEKGAQDTGHVIQKPPADIAAQIGKSTDEPSKPAEIPSQIAADAEAFVQELQAKSESELLTLSYTDVCSKINCHGVPIAIARQAATDVRVRKHEEVDLNVRRDQVYAAMASAGFSLFSLVVAFASFVRSGRSAKTAMTEKPEVAGIKTQSIPEESNGHVSIVS